MRQRRRHAFVAAVGLGLLGARAEQPECTSWAKNGECTANPDFMLANCRQACADNPLDKAGEPEQCIGWAQQGECTRNPKYMMNTCPKSCKDARGKMHDGALDDRADCLEIAGTADACAQSEKIRQGCKGTCATHSICADEADPPECERALRCRELKDDWADCADRVARTGCEDPREAGQLLKHCYLSCARVSRESLMRRYRLKYTVRTRNHSLIDEEARVPWRPAGAPTWSLPCWHGTLFDPPPPATCVRLVEDFLTAEEARHVIEVGTPHMHRSLAGGRTESIRTSSTGMLPAHDPIIRRITERAALVTGYPYENVEPLQLVKYVDGQKYEPHFDYGEACDYEENMQYGHRHVTMLVYLNSVPEERGGWTAFPKLNLRLNPKAHAAIVFNDCLPNGEEDPRTLHGGNPPDNHTKIAINVWIRAQSRTSKLWDF